ncbi:hypothetical protein V8E54_005182 [Elaphomyces granulatus]
MAPFTTAFLFPLLALPLNVLALGALPVCIPNIATYKTYTQGVVDGPVYLSSVSCLAESNGCSLSLSESYSISVTVTVGIHLGVNTDEASAGLDASVSWSKSTATTNTGGANCPAGGWTCGLAITPSVYQVTGYVTWSKPRNPCWTKTDGDYTIQYPMKDSQGKPIVKVWACACPDQLGWANAGAPPKCPSACNGA